MRVFQPASDGATEGHGQRQTFANEAMRQCRSCLEHQSQTRFRVQRRHRGKSYRASICNGCHAELERRRIQSTKRESDLRFLHRKWAELATAKQKRLSIQRLVLELMERFGGTKGVADLWHQACIEGTATRKLRAVEALIVTMHWLEEHSDILTGAAMLTDAELEDEMRTERIRAAAELIRDQPHVAATLAYRLGYNLTKVR